MLYRMPRPYLYVVHESATLSSGCGILMRSGMSQEHACNKALMKLTVDANETH